MFSGSWLADVDTPFGVETYELNVNQDGSIKIGSNRGSVDVPPGNVVFGECGETLQATFDIDAPMITTVQIDFDSKHLAGAVVIGEFLGTAFRCRTVEENV